MAMKSFRFGHASGDDWQQAVESCLQQVGEVPAAANLGFLYVTDLISGEMGLVLDRLQDATGVSHWVGAVGVGICATGREYYDEPAVAIMLGEFPPDSFRVFAPVIQGLDSFTARHGEWLADHGAYIGLVHGDASNPLTEAFVRQLAAATSSGFLVGGLASSRNDTYLIANVLTRGGVAGVLFSEQVEVATRLSQGCSPIGPHHRITEARRNIVITLDHRPALDALKADIGEILARDLSRIGGTIFAGLPISGSDTGDYLVRDLVGIDPNDGLVAIGDLVEQGGEVMFCRRDADTARDDLVRMLDGIKRQLGGRVPRGGIYVSCIGRGINLFGPDSAELRLIEQALGGFPLVGFYANGEISQDRLYAYTGVLTLFL